MKPISAASKVKTVTIDEAHAGQRIDNFLFSHLKGIPKSRIYRSLRQGEVRVNKKRAKPDTRLAIDDIVRIPPFRVSEVTPSSNPGSWQQQAVANNILFEDDNLIVINKPSGMAVHGGSGVNFGVIETIRHLRPRAKFLELAHRLDRDTSGCLLIAKKRSALVMLHELLRNQKIEKVYLALVRGRWNPALREVNLPLLKNELQSGERMVRVSDKGKSAITEFEPLRYFSDSTLVKVTLHTGRTHQIRVHAAHVGHPLAGDEKYGDENFNKRIRQVGLKRLFLHAASLNFQLPEQRIAICACLDADLLMCLQKLHK